MEIMNTEIDPREKMIEERLAKIGKIIIFSSGKGGVGKSTISAHTAYIASKNFKVGILDLDLHGPSIPFILGMDSVKIKESENGILPEDWKGIKIMSLDLFMQGLASPLRGNSKYEIIKEMIAITDFGDLDYLIVDMPPGTGDEYLAALEIFRRKGEIVFITAPSIISWQVTRRAVEIARNQIKIKGVLINMGKNDTINEECRKMRIKCLGNINYYEYVIDGKIENLIGTSYFRELENFSRIIEIIR